MNIPFSIHDFVIIYLVFTVVNREEDDYTVTDFSFETTCLKDEVKQTELQFFSEVCARARAQNYDFEYDVITSIRNIHPL